MTQMFNSQIQSPDQYVNPPIHNKGQTVFKNYFKFKDVATEQQFEDPEANYQQYPKDADYARFPVMINCQACKSVCMTDVQYEHGTASKFWCFVLLPLLCTGACCLCLSTCKDVRHTCSRCHADAGVNKSDIV